MVDGVAGWSIIMPSETLRCCWMEEGARKHDADAAIDKQDRRKR